MTTEDTGRDFYEMSKVWPEADGLSLVKRFCLWSQLSTPSLKKETP